MNVSTEIDSRRIEYHYYIFGWATIAIGLIHVRSDSACPIGSKPKYAKSHPLTFSQDEPFLLTSVELPAEFVFGSGWRGEGPPLYIMYFATS